MRDALINIRGMTNPEMNGEEIIEFVTEGYYDYGDVAKIGYRESALTGMEGTWTDVTVAPEEVTIKRSGNVNSQMLFQKDNKQYFLYETPYGVFTLGLETYSIFKRFGPQGGELAIHYAVDYDKRTSNRFSLQIRVTTEE